MDWKNWQRDFQGLYRYVSQIRERIGSEDLSNEEINQVG